MKLSMPWELDTPFELGITLNVTPYAWLTNIPIIIIIPTCTMLERDNND